MFGDDPDTTMATVRVGFGTTFGCAREEGRGLMREVKLGLTVSGNGLCGKPWAERREERDPATVFGDRKRPTLDRLYYCYSYPLGRQTDSECDEIWRAVYLHYNKTTANFHPFREHFSATYKIIFRRCRGRVQVCLGSERITERTGGTRMNASFENMQMQCR